MEFQIKNWERMAYMDTPVYIRADEPNWFVPNRAGDRVLQTLQEQGPPDQDLAAYRFLKRFWTGRRKAVSIGVDTIEIGFVSSPTGWLSVAGKRSSNCWISSENSSTIGVGRIPSHSWRA